MAVNKTRIGITVIAAALASAVPFIIDREDEKLTSYQDIVGVWTICSGETFGVNPTDKLTKDECKLLSQSRIGQFMLEIVPEIHYPISAPTLAAHTSFAYNIGLAGYKRSSTLRLTNQGDVAGGCKAMALWNKANGKISKGLINRRNEEIKLCLSGVK